MNILIADDHEVVRRGVRDLLSQEYPQSRIAEVGDASAAIESLMRPPWDLLLLDINMPGRDGLDVLAEARRLCPATPVLVLSMCPEEEFAVRAFKLGAAAYLNKASAADELLAAIRKVMAGGKYVSGAFAEKLAGRLSGVDPSAPHEALSNRELQVFRLIAQGRTIKEIAAELSLSDKTIGTYRLRIAEKMRLSTNVDIARYALKHGLVE
jgi:two-component system, NarL family, invasion response regulator UvrY